MKLDWKGDDLVQDMDVRTYIERKQCDNNLICFNREHSSFIFIGEAIKYRKTEYGQQIMKIVQNSKELDNSEPIQNLFYTLQTDQTIHNRILRNTRNNQHNN